MKKENCPVIESYRFGLMKISGVTYTSDLVLLIDHLKSDWRRKTSHKMHIEDIREGLRKKPEILIVGTGYFGRMKIQSDAEKFLQTEGIKLIAEKTVRAYKVYNKLNKSNRVVGAFHITC